MPAPSGQADAPSEAQRPPRLSVRGLKTHTATVERLDVAAGEIVALTGPSGSGKSLILRAIADLDPAPGTVLLDGTDRNAMPAPDWRRKVGYLAAETGWWAERVGVHFAARAAAAPLVERLGFPDDVWDWEIARLSTGEKQRLGLARMLAGGPEVLLLDEPTSALDPEATTSVEALIEERLSAGVAIILVTHDADQASRLARRHVTIRDARVTDAGGTP
ncbi:ABC transporter ATP-binding protein [Rhodobium gokarnense]|uniref:Phosphate-transporting ATPase n=1 Tax=Rhodobium gokarnense TaxID=364296 RepID=A0ABT3H7D5_9HYPH|nr:ABC transporter ATP-binding protein [Rhodobium gokarnense]MCW2306239.1 phosphate-transporting ATPase [Rhodobium gokarnense]